MRNFRNLANDNTIGDYYIDVLLGLFEYITKSWDRGHHAIATNKNGTRFIRFTDDYNPDTHTSSLQVQSLENTELFRPDTLIFASCLRFINSKPTVNDTAIMFFYGRPEIYTLIRRYDTYFTTQNFDGIYPIEDEQRHKYSDGGPARTPDPDVLAYLDNVIATSKSAAARASAQKYKNKLTNFKSRTVLENFKRMNLVAQMKHETFAEGRKLGQKSKSPKKQAAARANGKKAIEKIGKKYYAEIDYADGYKEIEFASGVDCFKYFSGANGKDKIFKNYSDFSRTMAKNNGEYLYKTGKMSVVIRVLGLIKPTRACSH